MLAKAVSILLKLAPIVLGCIAANNWQALASPEGRDLIQSLLYVLLPGVGMAATAGGAFYMDSKEKTAALHADPPAPADNSGNSLIQFKLPGVSLRLVVDVEKAKDKSFRDSIVASVKSGLDVRAATEAAK